METAQKTPLKLEPTKRVPQERLKKVKRVKKRSLKLFDSGTQKKYSGETTLLFQGERSEWELWKSRGAKKKGKGKEGLHWVEKLESPQAASKKTLSHVAVPSRHVFCLSLWLATDDQKLMPDLIRVQIERRGLASRSKSVMDFHLIRKEGKRTLVTVAVLPSSTPHFLCIENAERFLVSVELWKVSDSGMVLWHEGEYLVISFIENGEVVFFQGLSTKRIEAQSLTEIYCIDKMLRAQEVWKGGKRAVLYGSFSSEEAEMVGALCALPTEILERPSPKIPQKPFSLIPPEVESTQKKFLKRKALRRLFSIFLGVYLILLLGGLGYLVWLKVQVLAAQKNLRQNGEQVEKIKATAKKWKALAPAILPGEFVLETLWQVYQAMPEEGLRILSFEMQGDNLTVRAEAKSAPVAANFLEKLKKNKKLKKYRWPVSITPSGFVNGGPQFTIQAKG